MSNCYPSDKFLLVDAKTAAKQADEVKTKLEAKRKEQELKEFAEKVTKLKLEIASRVNLAIDKGDRSIFFDLGAELPDVVEEQLEEWLKGLGYKRYFDVTTLRVEW
jgi:hypothetical protein